MSLLYRNGERHLASFFSLFFLGEGKKKREESGLVLE
jgi:hypothetical protein